MQLLGLGLDLCSIARMAALLEKHPRRLPERLLHVDELAHGPLTPVALAKKFAAKEAVAKALGTGIGKRLSFQDIVVFHGRRAAPLVGLTPEAQLRFGQVQFLLTLTQEGDTAAAAVLAWQERGDEPH
mgnify:CR=1 FL=1